MAIGAAKVGTVAESSSTTSITGNLPGSLADDDILFAFFAVGTAGEITLDAPAGWNTMIQPMLIAAAQGYLIYWKWVTDAGSETAPTVSWTTAARGSAHMIAYAGVSLTHPFDTLPIFQLAGPTTTTSLAISALTTVTDNAKVVSFCGCDTSSANDITKPAEQTDRSHTTGTGRRSAIADETKASAGSTGTRTWTISASLTTVASMVALRPASYPTVQVMPIDAVRAATTWQAPASSVSISPTYPASLAEGDIVFAELLIKPNTATVATPANWTLVATKAGGGGVQGAGTGPIRAWVFQREVPAAGLSGSQTFTITSGSSPIATMIGFSYDSSGVDANPGWDWAVDTGYSNASQSTTLGGTGSADIDLDADDYVRFLVGTSDDECNAITLSNLTAADATFDTLTADPNATATNGQGNDISGKAGYRAVLTGPSSAAPVVTATGNTSEYSMGLIYRVRAFGEVAVDAAITAAALGCAASVPAPAVRRDATRTAVALGISTTIPARTVNAGAVRTAVALKAAASVPAPVVRRDATRTAVALKAAATIPSRTMSTGQTRTAIALKAAASVPAPVVRRDATQTAAALGITTTIPARTVSAGATPAAAALGITAIIPSRTVSTGSTRTAVALALAATVPAAAVGIGAEAHPSLLAALAGIPAPGLRTDQTRSAVALALAASVPTVVASGGATRTAVALGVLASVPAPGLSTSAIRTAVGLRVRVVVPGPGISTQGNAIITHGPLGLDVSVPAVAVATGSTRGAVALGALASVPAPGLHTDQTVAASALGALVGTPVPVLHAGQEPAATALAILATVPLAAASGGAERTAVALGALASVPAPVIDLGSTAILPPLGIPVVIPAHTIVIVQDTTVSPAGLGLLVAVRVPTIIVVNRPPRSGWGSLQALLEADRQLAYVPVPTLDCPVCGGPLQADWCRWEARHVPLPKPPDLSAGGVATMADGDWSDLTNILRESRDQVKTERQRGEIACPKCGEPLRDGRCRFDGYQSETPTVTTDERQWE